MEAPRPRVLALGLDDPQARSIDPLCGELRRADTLQEYLEQYSWTETDIVISREGLIKGEHVAQVHLMTVGLAHYERSRSRREHRLRSAYVTENTEREVSVASDCPPQYATLAAELSERLGRSPDPPVTFDAQLGGDDQYAHLITTTSGRPSALRLVFSHDGQPETIDILLPDVPNLSEWFRVFLDDIHSTDPVRVPTEPPRLMRPSDWYTPEERRLAEEIAAATLEIERLGDRRTQLQAELAEAGAEADSRIRQAVWGDGDELVTAVVDILTDLGFEVLDMDKTLPETEPKREDLRLTHQDYPDWKAIVEVKGYSRGTRTNDSRQIREHRERYIIEKGRAPSLTLWLANPYRGTDPSSRPPPDRNVGDTAEQIGAVHALASDLYLRWTLVKTGRLDQGAAVQSLIRAEPGLWAPSAPAVASDATASD